eukprot:3105228-Rhodomonas_salina.1
MSSTCRLGLAATPAARRVASASVRLHNSSRSSLSGAACSRSSALSTHAALWSAEPSAASCRVAGSTSQSVKRLSCLHCAAHCPSRRTSSAYITHSPDSE